jgi:hypothetical protein
VRIAPPADTDIRGLTLSPEGSYVYYVTQPRGSGMAGLYKIPTLGGAPIVCWRTLPVHPPSLPTRAAWPSFEAIPT